MAEKREPRGIALTDQEHRLLKAIAKKDGRSIASEVAYLVKRRAAEWRRDPENGAPNEASQ